MSRFYLGIDGGQSSTLALIADETGLIVGAGRGGPCNHVAKSEGRARFLGAIRDCLYQACAQAGLDSKSIRFAAACLGFSGGPEDKEALSCELIASDKYKVTHDAEIALTGATAGGPGIIIIAGTGSMAFGRNAEGRMARAGGWGYVYGDEGGAFDMVRQAIRAALRFEEGWGPETSLYGQLLAATSSASANTLLHRLYGELERNEVAKLAPMVAQAAEKGDHVAIAVVERAAGKLAWFTAGVYRNLFPRRERIPLIPVGGAFSNSLLRSTFAANILIETGCETVSAQFSPVSGAVLEALRMDGNSSELRGAPEFEKWQYGRA